MVVDPGFGQSLTDESLAVVDQPVLLINLGLSPARWAAIDVGETGSRLHMRIKAALYMENPDANHFSFPGQCKDGANRILEDEGEDPICNDPESSNHPALHQTIAEKMFSF